MARQGNGEIRGNKRKILIGSAIAVLAVFFVSVFLPSIPAGLFSGPKPEPLLKVVSGTEYISNEEGQIIVRVQDNDDNPIEDADCIVSLLYPDKSFYFVDKPMSPTSVPGNYYYSFTTPGAVGVYEEHIRCTVETGDESREMKISSSFHVSAGLNLVVEMSRSQREQYNSLMQKINAVDGNLSSKISSVNLDLNGLRERIDENVMDKMQLLDRQIEDVNANVTGSIAQIEQNIQQSQEREFGDLYQKFRNAYTAMSTAFDQNSPS